jgi:hypothetical protein
LYTGHTIVKFQKKRPSMEMEGHTIACHVKY